MIWGYPYFWNHPTRYEFVLRYPGGVDFESQKNGDEIDDVENQAVVVSLLFLSLQGSKTLTFNKHIQTTRSYMCL